MNTILCSFPKVVANCRIDLDKPRTRTVLAAKVHALGGNTDCTARQAAYDLRKLRGHDLVAKPPRSSRPRP
jgi:hypothetical protein